jgi:hypothetical protein
MEPFSPCGVVCRKLLTEEDAMEAALERIMLAYDLLANRTPSETAAARAQVTDYVTTLFEAGVTADSIR